ncbi:MAG: glucose-6-phosphate dehydrogenase [Chlamydiae bacterium CG10_big_fil_rev_8_21_14_0_10_42_34]|nr:MAG: glucose-6-phosphate dehydrogenase [Chlamydiae bacterium CG10_big_fil_rev_8_21_14_0_10_42_34]
MSMDNHPLEETGRSTRNIDPCTVVIFGATGDLTGRKLAPAIYNLGREGLLPANFACVGFARREKTNEQFREELKTNINEHSRTKPIDDSFWKNFENQVFYHRSEFDSDEGYQALAELLKQIDAKHATRGNRVFYLSVQPKFFPIIIEKLAKNGLIYDTHKTTDQWSRVIIEKPFGHNASSAKELQANISKHLDESQIYRIDHYLGKETVQNLLVFRFANAIFESLWNYKHINQVQITVAEDIGIGTRGHFFEEEGLLRDVVQNHMMQLLSLVAMEPPVSLSAGAIRDEKVKVLQSIRPLTEEDFKSNVVRGQYGPGFINGQKTLGYREEKDVDPKSNIETFLALRLFIDNWRWAGVPFYLRGGKRLPKRGTEIAIVFNDAPGVLFKQNGRKNDPNVLAMRIQPDEGIAMKINCKVPGPSSPIQPVKMDFRYGSYFGQSPPEAYERLIWDCITGDSTLFARADEVEQSWKILTPLLDHWEKNPKSEFPNYAAGTWGPAAADEMIAKDNRSWRIL